VPTAYDAPIPYDSYLTWEGLTPAEVEATSTSSGIPLCVRLTNDNMDTYITSQVSDVSYRAVVPGGFASATFSLHHPLRWTPDMLAIFTDVTVYDGRSGAVMWQGRLEDPARALGSEGEVWSLTAIGPSAHASDQTTPLIYVDSRLSAWERLNTSNPVDAEVSVGNNPAFLAYDSDDRHQALILRFPEGTTLDYPTLNVAEAIYAPVLGAGQTIGRLTYDISVYPGVGHYYAIILRDATVADTYVESRVATSSSTGDYVGSSTSGTYGWTLWDPAWLPERITIRIERAPGGAGTKAPVGAWVAFAGLRVLGTRVGKDGGAPSVGGGDFVYAHNVVDDLLGRLLSRYDGPNAVVTAAAVPFEIRQFAYPEGTTAGGVLNDLMTFDPTYYWAAWEAAASGGRHYFEWVTYPTTVAYEVGASDGFSSPASAGELYNQVLVRWKDVDGRSRITVRTSTVTELTSAGLTRSPPSVIELGSEVGTEAAAELAGDKFLVGHASAANAGTFVARGPMFDLNVGRMVQPWELPRLAPGKLIKIRDVAPRVDALNPTASDGTTTFRVRSVDYSSSSNEATLALESEATSAASLLAGSSSGTRN
jgi:hypothetical protein